jgi:hypothetical protein
MKQNVKILALGILCLFLNTNYRSATRISKASGFWSNTSTWVGNAVPTCGDSIVVLAVHAVTISNQQNYTCGSAIKLTVKGVLYFINGKKLTMPCGSQLYAFPGCTIASDGGGSSNTIEICNTTYWSSSGGDLAGPSCMPPSPGCNSILPIELVSFDGNVCEKNICLKWVTASEKNNAFFLVERAIDGIDFTSLGKVNSAFSDGNSHITQRYAYQDQSPAEGINYYRFRQVDKNSDYVYSPIVAVNYATKDLDFSVFPNPNNGQFEISFNLKQEASLEILNSLGELLHRQSIASGESIFMNRLAPGVYFCRLNCNGSYLAKKILVR